MANRSEILDGNKLISNIVADAMGLKGFDGINVVSEAQGMLTNSVTNITYLNDKNSGKLFLCCGFNVFDRLVHPGNRPNEAYPDIASLGLKAV